MCGELTSGWRQLEVVDLTEADGEDAGRGGVVAEPVGAVDRTGAIDADHQVVIL